MTLLDLQRSPIGHACNARPCRFGPHGNNVVNVKFDFTTVSVENGYEGLCGDPSVRGAFVQPSGRPSSNRFARPVVGVGPM